MFDVPDDLCAGYAIADWRLRVSTLYAEVRACETAQDGWNHWVAGRNHLFRHHPMSPVPEDQRPAFTGISLFQYDPAWRLTCGLIPASGEGKTFELGWDGAMRVSPCAQTSGLAGRLGRELTLWWIEGYGGGLFLPFRDASNGGETYGGGRYLIDAIKGADLGLDHNARLILDFNFAYAPSCARNNAYVCPLAPPENQLEITIRAGERK